MEKFEKKKRKERKKGQEGVKKEKMKEGRIDGWREGKWEFNNFLSKQSNYLL